MLTAQEQKELDELEARAAVSSAKSKSFSGLSPQEESELAELENRASAQSGSSTGQSLEALVSGFGKQATLGYLPQIQAATEPIIQGALNLFGSPEDNALREQGFTITPKEESYTERRDRAIREQMALEEASPVASTIGQVAGGLSGLLLPGAGAAKGAGALAKAGQAVKGGLISGLLRNPGDTEGEISLIQPEERAVNVASDIGTGLVFQGAAQGLGSIGKTLKEAPKTLKTFSELKALKASGAMLKDFKSAISKGKASRLGQSAIDEGLIAVGDDISDIAKKSRLVQREVGDNIENIYKTADQLDPTGIDLGQISSKIKADIDQKLKGMVGGTKLKQSLFQTLDEIGDNGNVSLQKLREIRTSIDDNINFAKRQSDMPKLESELTDIRNKIQQEIKRKLGDIDKVNGTDLAESFTRENRRYSNIADLSKMAGEKVAREESNASFGLRERISGGVGAGVGAGLGTMIGGPVGGVVGAAASGLGSAITTKVARQYGTPFVAITANKLAKALDKNPQVLGKFSDTLIKAGNASPEQFVRTVNLLMKEPEFKKKMESVK